jgi:hypothetical protein
MDAHPEHLSTPQPNVLHTFKKNETSEVANLKLMIVPPGMEQFFVEAGVED